MIRTSSADGRWADLRLLQAPTLAVHATASFGRCDVMTRMAAEMPRAQLVHLPRRASSPVANPGGLASEVAGFLRDS